MTDKEIKVDCKQFIKKPIKGGGEVTCNNYVRGGGCTLVEKEMCKIMKPMPEFMPGIKRLSHSAVSAFIDCRRHTWLERIKKIRPRIREGYFTVGSILHTLTESYYLGDYSASFDSVRTMFEQESHEDPKLEAAKALTTMECFVSYAGDTPLLQIPELELEYVHDTTWTVRDHIHMNYPLQYRYDGITKDRSLFIEHKFTGTSSLETIKKIDHVKQVALGFILMPDAQKCILNLVKKINFKFNPAKESIEAFMDRSEIDIKKNPSKYFKQFVFERDEIDLQAEENEFTRAASDLVTLPLDVARFYKNTKECTKMGNCRYLPICDSMVVNPELYYMVPLDYVYKPKEEKKEELK